jgi:dihydropteroate synthase
MGILNVTPDSFSDGGLHLATEAACAHARRMRAEGADLIDIGGESTRPGSEEVPIEQELARVLPVIRTLVEEDVPLSIDSRHVEVVRAALAEGVAVVNDVSGFRCSAMVELVATADAEVGCVVMHMLGEPKHMQSNPHYDDVLAEVEDYLLTQAQMLEAAGVARERICIDPGPGFGKDFEHNLQLLRATARFAALGYPLMAAYSRKTLIGQLTGVSLPAERVAGSVTAALWAASQGAAVLRVHDVAATVQALKVLSALTDAPLTDASDCSSCADSCI